MIPISSSKAARRGILAPSPVSPNELGALRNAEFIGEKNFKLLEWLRRQSLTKEAAEKIAPQTCALQKGIDEKDAREQARIDTLRRIEQEIRDELESLRAASTERAVVIDEAGNVVIDKRGVQNSVKFTDEELALMAGKTLTHNHNINTTISYEDAEVFFQAELSEIRAVTGKTTYSIRRTADTPKLFTVFRKGWEAAYEELSLPYLEKVKKGAITKIGAGKLLLEEIWEVLKKSLKLTYSKEQI